MIPNWAAPYLFGFFLSGLMSLIVSGVSTFRVTGFGEGVVALWLSAWLASWVIAFPSVLIVAPLARRLVARLVRDE